MDSKTLCEIMKSAIQDLQGVIDGFYNNFVDSRNANTALEEHLVSINNEWNIQDEVQWWDENQEYSIKVLENFR